MGEMNERGVLDAAREVRAAQTRAAALTEARDAAMHVYDAARQAFRDAERAVDGIYRGDDTAGLQLARCRLDDAVRGVEDAEVVDEP